EPSRAPGSIPTGAPSPSPPLSPGAARRTRGAASIPTEPSERACERMPANRGDARLNDHPTSTELDGFAWNRLSAERRRAVVLHLLRGCEPCMSALAPHIAGLLGLAEPPQPVLSDREEADYEAALERAFARALRKAGNPERRTREALAVPLE